MFAAWLPDEAVTVGDTWQVAPSAYRTLLKQFLPGVRTTAQSMGLRVPGGCGCLRALSADHAELIFRVHADFTLANGQGIFAPAQFRGRMLIGRQSKKVLEFRLWVPPRNTNTDILARRGEHFSADIAFIPRMELRGGDQDLSPLWSHAIGEDLSRHRLASKFYRFVDIAWEPLATALATAARTKRPLHLMILFGTLDDESC